MGIVTVFSPALENPGADHTEPTPLYGRPEQMRHPASQEDDWEAEAQQVAEAL